MLFLTGLHTYFGFSRKFKRDIDVIRENHKFLWLDEEPCSWEEQLAKKYYDRLYKEYCVCDLTRYEEGEVRKNHKLLEHFQL